MRLLIAGDYYPGPDSDISSVVPLLEGVDYGIVNYESPVPNSSNKAIPKQGPNLKSAYESAEKLRTAGFKCVTLANNHTLDYGEDGLLETFNVIDRLGFDRVGAGTDLTDAGKILYKKFPDGTVAIINCCEHEFSVATENTAGTNPINPIRQYKSIQEARKNADYVLVIVHGGHEHYKLPSPRMQELYRFYIDAGADAVVSHHQHFYSGYEIYKGKPVFYGLGNFVFPWPNASRNWQEGYLVEIEFKSSSPTFKLYPYIQNESVGIRLMDENEKKSFESDIAYLNSIIKDGERLRSEHQKWMRTREKVYVKMLVPYTNRILTALWRKKLLPSFISQKKILGWINYIDCESHRDVMLEVLKNKVKK